MVFYANGALRRLPVAGGVPVIVCETDGCALRDPVELTMASCSFSRARESSVFHPTAARPRRSCALTNADGLVHDAQLLPGR